MPPPDPTTAAEGWNFRAESQVCSRRPKADRATAWPALCPVFPPKQSPLDEPQPFTVPESQRGSRAGLHFLGRQCVQKV